MYRIIAFLLLMGPGLWGCGAESTVLIQADPLTPEEIGALPGQSGELRFHMHFNNHIENDIDLHVIEPNGNHLYFSNPSSASGGALDVDCMCDYCPKGPSENIFWSKNQAGTGIYEIWVQHFTSCFEESSDSEFTLFVLEGDQVKASLEGRLNAGQSPVLYYQFSR